MKLLKVSVLSVLLVGLLGGCGNPQNKILENEQIYWEWLQKNQSFLTKLPKEAILIRELNFYHSRGKILPSIDLTIKANRPDAVFQANYVLNVDDNYQPTSINTRLSQMTFFVLTTRKKSKSPEGKIKHAYFGVSISESREGAITGRLLRGDKFDDLVTQAEKSKTPLRKVTVEFDKWANL